MSEEFRFCEHLGCTSQDVRDFVHPSTYMGEDAPGYESPVIEYLCDKHAQEFGYCLGCGSFCGGIESYEFSEVPGYCDECVDMFRDDTGEYDDDEDDWDEDDY